MSALTYAVKRVRATVYPQLLNKVYAGKDMYGFQTYSVDETILANVIRCRVLPDINIMGGQMQWLPASQAQSSKFVSGNAYYQYTDADFHGNQLVSVLDFQYGASSSYSGDVGSALGFDPGMLPVGGSLGCGGSGSCSIGGTGSGGCSISGTGSGGGSSDPRAGVNQARAEADHVQNPWLPRGISKVKLIGKNIITIQDVTTVVDGWFRVLLSHDAELTDVQPRSWLPFSELCMLAVKADIYNLTKITAAEAEIKNGYKIDAYSSAIDEYSDAEEKYQEKLLVWMSIAASQDPERTSLLLGLQLNPYMYG